MKEIDINTSSLEFSSDTDNLPKINKKTVEIDGVEKETDVKVTITSLPNSDFKETTQQVVDIDDLGLTDEQKKAYLVLPDVVEVNIEDVGLTEKELEKYKVDGKTPKIIKIPSQYINRLKISDENIKKYKTVLPKYVNVSLIKDFRAADWEFESDITVLSINEMLLKDSVPKMTDAKKIFTSDMDKKITSESTESESLVKKLTAKTADDDTFPKLKNYSVKPYLLGFPGLINVSEMFTADYWKNALGDLGKGLLGELTSGLDDLGGSLLSWLTTPAGSKTNFAVKYEKNKNRDYASPIQVLLGRNPDMFSNMYDVWFAKSDNPMTQLGKEDKLIKSYTTATQKEESLPRWKLYSARINGIDIPQPKRTTFQRQACGMTLEIPKTEVSLNKIFELSLPVDANYTCVEGEYGIVNVMSHVSTTGSLMDFFFQNKETFDFIVKYKPLYGTKPADSYEPKYSVTYKEGGKKTTYTLNDNDEKPVEVFDDDPTKSDNPNSVSTTTNSNSRYFIFKNVRCLGTNINDLQYNNQAANTMECKLKFTFRSVAEVSFKTYNAWKNAKSVGKK